MGFNPITGGGTTSAHTHSNAASDGGSLDLTSTTIENTLNPLTTVIIFGD